MSTIYVHPQGTGDGSQSKPFDLPNAVAHFRSGDTLLLQGPGTYPAIGLPARLNGATVGSYGSGRPTVDAPCGLGFLLATGALEVFGIDFIDSTRDPAAPGFKPHPGQIGIYFRECDGATVHLHDCSFRWHEKAIDVEANHQEGTIIERLKIGPCYGWNRPQGIYASGQFGMVIRDNEFDTCGWYPVVCPASTNQSHAIYCHSGDPVPADACGPVTIIGNTFHNCASGGPTSNSGGNVTDNTILDCAQDGSGMAAWISGPAGVFARNIIRGGFFNAISKDAQVFDNLFLSPGSIAVNVDVPAKSIGWRTAANVVTCQRNTALNFSGRVVSIVNASGAKVVDQGNQAVPILPDVLSRLLV